MPGLRKLFWNLAGLCAELREVSSHYAEESLLQLFMARGVASEDEYPTPAISEAQAELHPPAGRGQRLHEPLEPDDLSPDSLRSLFSANVARRGHPKLDRRHAGSSVPSERDGSMGGVHELAEGPQERRRGRKGREESPDGCKNQDDR